MPAATEVTIYTDRRAVTTSVWTPPPAVTRAAPPPLYLAVLGNTGSGKSTLVGELAAALACTRARIVAIDERATHHPFLDRLFFDPSRYAFELQLNFMLQRVLIARRWLDAGYDVVMERSHLDDPVFIEHLKTEGYASAREREAYLGLWRNLAGRSPEPDLLVALDIDPALCIERVSAAEQAGHRPREFSDEQTKERWISAWGASYRQRLDQLAGEDRYAGRLIKFSDDRPTRDIASAVLERLKPPPAEESS